MKIEQSQDEIIITETPGCFWIIGLFFAFIGGIFVYGSGGGFVDYGRHPPWLLGITFVMGMIGVGSGVWFIYNAPITKVVINRDRKTVIMSRWGLFGRRDFLYHFDDIARFCLIAGRDDEGSLIWTFGMELADGEMIPITSIGSHAEDYEQKYVFQTNEFMGKQLSPTELIFELEDEINDEIN